MENAFAQAVKPLKSSNKARTANNMKAKNSTKNAVVDLFYAIGASRGQDITPEFEAAWNENPDLALRVLLWARDVRGGAGERQIFRDVLKILPEKVALKILPKVPELGRWDDLLVFYPGSVADRAAMDLISKALDEGNGLCAKWMPRKGKRAVELRNYLGLNPKQYRKLLVGLTNVVETKMCNRDWNNIEFDKVPALAHARYRSAFYRNSSTYEDYVEKLSRGEAKVNTGAVYPYDVLKNVFKDSHLVKAKKLSQTEKKLIVSQWNALPDMTQKGSSCD